MRHQNASYLCPGEACLCSILQRTPRHLVQDEAIVHDSSFIAISMHAEKRQRIPLHGSARLSNSSGCPHLLQIYHDEQQSNLSDGIWCMIDSHYPSQDGRRYTQFTEYDKKSTILDWSVYLTASVKLDYEDSSQTPSGS